MSRDSKEVSRDTDNIQYEEQTAEVPGTDVAAPVDVASATIAVTDESEDWPLNDELAAFEDGTFSDVSYEDYMTGMINAGDPVKTGVYTIAEDPRKTGVYTITDDIQKTGVYTIAEDIQKTGVYTIAEDPRRTVAATRTMVDTAIGQGIEGGADNAEETAAEPQQEELDPEAEAIRKRIKERKIAKKKKARMRQIKFWTFLSLFLLVISMLLFSLSSVFTVDSIEVTGNSRFTAEEIINIAHAVPGHNIIYNPGSKDIVNYLEQNPYIKSASVTRKLPSTLVINVEERKQACAFKYDDDYLVMDDEGILLKKSRTEPKITMINGLVVSKIRLGETIGTEDQQMFSKTLKIIRAMKDADLYFVRLDMSEFSDDEAVRAYIYDKLIVKTNYDKLITNLNNGRLHRVVEKLFEDGTKRGTITFGDDGTASFEPGF